MTGPGQIGCRSSRRVLPALLALALLKAGCIGLLSNQREIRAPAP